jgi:hypothetical protein
MKKKTIMVLSLLIISAMLLAGCSVDSSVTVTTAEPTQEMANPWTESDEQGVAEATGFDMVAPEGATNVSYSYMSEGALAQMTYELDGANWNYRIQMANELTDISGMNYAWMTGTDGSVSGRNAIYYAYNSATSEGNEIVNLVNWYDAVCGVTYSLSATGKEISDAEMQTYAENLYVPLQGEATDDPVADQENELNDYFLGEHKRSYDESVLTISDNGDGTYCVNLSIIGLCNLENGVGTFDEHKMAFTIQDPNEEEMSGVIYRDNDNSLVVEITNSTWGLLATGEVLDGFGK